MLVTIRTSREADRNFPVRSITTVCGRPTGNPVSLMTVFHAPRRSRTCSDGGLIATGRCEAATLSFENA